MLAFTDNISAKAAWLEMFVAVCGSSANTAIAYSPVRKDNYKEKR